MSILDSYKLEEIALKLNEKLFVIIVAKCKQSSILTSIQTT
jgi:hypothetical protein